MSLRLRLVTAENSEELSAIAREFADAGESGFREAIFDPTAYLEKVRRFAEGVDLPPDRVRSAEYWLLDRDLIVGNCRVRPSLIPKLELDGGNISYDVRPSERGRGYGREILRLALLECVVLGLRRALLTTSPENARSIRVIRANGGVELDRSVSPFSGEELIRWEVALPIARRITRP